MTRYLFVYGTLRRGAGHRMNRVLAAASRFAGSGTVVARLYDLGGYPGIVLSNDTGERVNGEVYELGEADAADVLRLLDRYEEMGPDDPLPHEYGRVHVDVHLDNATKLTAWAYVLADPAPSHPLIAASDYLVWKNGQTRN